MAWLRLGKRAAERGEGEDRSPSSPPVATDRHGSVQEADPYSFAVAHRRLAWMLRLSAGANVALVAGVVVLASTISVLVPLKHTEIALVRADPADDRLYRIEPISQRVAGFDVLMEAMARRYTRISLEINPLNSQARYREATAMTDRAFSDRFRRSYLETREYQQAVESGLVRSIEVESVNRVEMPAPPWNYVVDFVQIDTRDGAEVQRRPLRAYLSMTTRPQEVSEADRYMNPLGITVLDMRLRERGTQ